MVNLIQVWNNLNCVTVLQNKNVLTQFWSEITNGMNKNKLYYFFFFFFFIQKKKKETWYFGLLTWYDPAEIEHWSTEKCWAFLF